MFSSQIRNALSSDPYVTGQFGGVFPSDKLPDKVPFPCALIANTDPSFESGEHWVCFYFDSDGNAEYFDSYGLPPSNCDLWKFFQNNGFNHACNTKQLQGLTSKVCGHYCIAFLAKRARGESMDSIVKQYSGKSPGAKDKIVGQLVNDAFQIKNMQSGGGRIEQCCCCRRNKHTL